MGDVLYGWRRLTWIGTQISWYTQAFHMYLIYYLITGRNRYRGPQKALFRFLALTDTDTPLNVP